MSTHVLEHGGCHLSYEVAGEGPPVLFIQGVGVHGRGWSPQVEALSSGFRCLSFDNRGMGASQPLTLPLTVEQMTEDALALLTCQGWDSAHVVGHSLGGPIALELALSAPERVRSLALLCTVARGRDATRLSRRMLWLGLRSAVGTRQMRRRAFLEIVLPPAALAAGDAEELAARLAPLFGHDLADQPPVAMRQMGALRAYDATARLGRLAGIPTLVVSATHDPIAPPRYGRALAEGVPGARFVEIPEASHGVTIQHAEQINTLLKEHLAQAEELRGT
ncbi:MAG TPA: alpha/beta fold hydrolase [Longimicrobium sp.]|jgi:pimeloyl-ACP methyl ester carboxylesterase